MSKRTQWLRGEVDLTEALEERRAHPGQHYGRRHKQEHLLAQIEQQYHRFETTGFRILAGLFCAFFFSVLLLSVAMLPRYGAQDAPAMNEVATRYLEKGMAETGAVNTVAGMILDYRAFDTLGESFVLFSAVCAVLILMRNSNHTDLKLRTLEHSHYHFYRDDITKTLGKAVIPMVYMLGFYIILNGHLSPGGGFSGGAVLGAGCILYAVIYGEKSAQRIFTEKRIKTVTLCALMFYCLAKGYSFYTGANQLHSVISAGIPGRIFSAGLILPLNTAVGLVVCCTMYSMYMLFRRGDF